MRSLRVLVKNQPLVLRLINDWRLAECRQSHLGGVHDAGLCDNGFVFRWFDLAHCLREALQTMFTFWMFLFSPNEGFCGKVRVIKLKSCTSQKGKRRRHFRPLCTCTYLHIQRLSCSPSSAFLFEKKKILGLFLFILECFTASGETSNACKLPGFFFVVVVAPRFDGENWVRVLERDARFEGIRLKWWCISRKEKVTKTNCAAP